MWKRDENIMKILMKLNSNINFEKGVSSLYMTWAILHLVMLILTLFPISVKFVYELQIH